MSHELFNFAHSPQVLKDFVDAYNCGWFDGGCFIFARGLQLWVGGRLAVIVRKRLYCDQTFDHCFLSVPDPLGRAERLYIDANGVSPEQEFLRYWRTYENLPDAILEDPLDRIRLVGHLENDRWSIWLAKQMTHRFGKPKTCELLDRLGSVMPRDGCDPFPRRLLRDTAVQRLQRHPEDAGSRDVGFP